MIANIIILVVVGAIFVYSSRKFIISVKKGQCGDCASGCGGGCQGCAHSKSCSHGK